MQLGRCPVCHHRIDIQSILQDEAGSKLLGLLARQPKDVAEPLIQYLALFRPAKTDLTNMRALKLAQEVLAMGGPLATALDKTVASIMKQRAGQSLVKPLANHKYLQQVLDTLGAPAKKMGYQPVHPGEIKGAKHKQDEMKKQVPDDAKAVMQSLGIKSKSDGE